MLVCIILISCLLVFNVINFIIACILMNKKSEDEVSKEFECEVAVEDEPKVEKIDYKTLTLKELKKIAKEKNVPRYYDKNKETLIKELKKIK